MASGSGTNVPTWFVAGLSRTKIKDMADQLLEHGEDGDFMIRDVEKHPGSYGLSIKRANEPKLKNFLIERKSLPDSPESVGFKFRGASAASVFRSIQELVAYYSKTVAKPLDMKLRVRGVSNSASIPSKRTPPSSTQKSSPKLSPSSSSHEQKALLDYVLQSDKLTAEAQWFVPKVTREEIRTMVQNMSEHGQEGDFIVRELGSNTSSGFGMSVKSEKGIVNFKLEKRFSKGGENVKVIFRLRGANDNLTFPSISSLVYHYATSKKGINGTKLLLRPEDMVQYANAYKDDHSKFGIDDYSSKAPWLLVGADRSELKLILTQLLQDGTEGSFIIRDVVSEPGCFGLSVKMSGGKLPNYLIERIPIPGGNLSHPGFQLRGTASEEVFGSLAMLVYYYATSMIGVMGQQLSISASERSELELFLESEYSNEYKVVAELAKAMVPGTAAFQEIVSKRASTTVDGNTDEKDDNPDDDIQTIADVTNTVVDNTDAPVGADGRLLLVYTISFTIGDVCELTTGSTIAVALYGSEGSTTMRTLSINQSSGGFKKNIIVSAPVVLEDVGKISKIAIGVQVGMTQIDKELLSIKSISIESSSGRRCKMMGCDLTFGSRTGLYQECKADDVDQNEISFLPGSSRATHGREVDPGGAGVALGQNLQVQLKELRQLMEETQKHITIEQQKVASVEATILAARMRVEAEKNSLHKANADFEAVHTSTKADRKAITDLKKAYNTLSKQVETEDKRLVDLISSRDSIFRDIAKHNASLHSTESQVVTVTREVTNCINEIKVLRNREKRLDMAIGKDNRRLEVLRNELARAQANDELERVADIETKALHRAKANALAEQRQREERRKLARATRQVDHDILVHQLLQKEIHTEEEIEYSLDSFSNLNETDLDDEEEDATGFSTESASDNEEEDDESTGSTVSSSHSSIKIDEISNPSPVGYKQPPRPRPTMSVSDRFTNLKKMWGTLSQPDGGKDEEVARLKRKLEEEQHLANEIELTRNVAR